VQNQHTTKVVKAATIAQVLTYTYEGIHFRLGLNENGSPRWIAFNDEDFKSIEHCTGGDWMFLSDAAASVPEDETLHASAMFAFYANLGDKDKQAMRALQLLLVYQAQRAGKGRPKYHITPERARELQKQLLSYFERLSALDPLNIDDLGDIKALLALPTE
jgi:hypothetical protein